MSLSRRLRDREPEGGGALFVASVGKVTDTLRLPARPLSAALTSSPPLAQASADLLVQRQDERVERGEQGDRQHGLLLTRPRRRRRRRVAHGRQDGGEWRRVGQLPHPASSLSDVVLC